MSKQPPATEDSRFKPSGAAPTRPAGPWPDTHRGVFGPTVFDTVLADTQKRPAPSLVFDVCHVGVVLRTVLFVHAVLGAGLLFAAADAPSWLTLLGLASGVALPSVLLWLTAACALRRWLARASAPMQWVAAAMLGAAAGAFGWWIGGLTGLELFAARWWLAPLGAGAGLAMAVTLWLQLRARTQLPADTTARLAELQSRIRPHFLFNTLNSALTLVRLDPVRAERVLEDLAELFRVALTNTGEAVTLDDEIELARRYLAIEQIRFGDRLSVSWELDAAAGSAKVPPLLLQPLVENAVRHGVEPADEGGAIRIRTRVRLGRALVSVANSVAGTPSQRGHGIALRNVRDRLKLMHDVAGQIETRRDGQVFRVQITLPLDG